MRWPSVWPSNAARIISCRSCRRLRSFDLVFEDQKIAACGSSYRFFFASCRNSPARTKRTDDGDRPARVRL
ncbi:hypothetical protein DBR18_04425 [Pseudomonas sp. HMWF021]|nr:hypothetical protein DBR18_04425 [Pseudomonas sp. HMWF021]